MNENLTEFTQAWEDFEHRLAVFLGELTFPTLHDRVRLYPPNAVLGGDEIVFAGVFADQAEGVVVSLGNRDTVFHPRAVPDADADAAGSGFAEAAHDITQHIRMDWGLPHPEFITGVADGWAATRLRELGVRSHGDVRREDEEHEVLRRRRARGFGRVASTAAGIAPRDLETDLVFAASSEELREAVESVLHREYGEVLRDADGDYRVDCVPILGTDFYLTVLEDRPLIRLWKIALPDVRSRRAAIIEANYLNRTHPLARWVLWGHDLVQEIYVPAASFSPSRLEEMLDTFADHYRRNNSALRLRLGGEYE